MRGDLDLAEGRLAVALRQLGEVPLITSLQGMLHARRNQADRLWNRSARLWVLVDPHLESLRGEAEFKRLVADLERKYGALKVKGVKARESQL